jgi:adenylosuccinate lyase
MQELSPLDGRYKKLTEPLRAYFSEYALIRARLFIEISYFIALCKELKIKLPQSSQKKLWNIVHKFTLAEAKKVKSIEGKARHDVKAVEYYLREKVKKVSGCKQHIEFIHFGLTSEDVNNLAYGMLIHESLKEVIVPSLQEAIRSLKKTANGCNAPVLSLTHGQSATPTTMKKELLVFADRLERQLTQLKAFRMQGKFGGAVGTYSAHRVAYPKVKWEAFGKKFMKNIGLTPLTHTTQINPHDDIAELSHIFYRTDTILLDLSRDMWHYISRGIFAQRAKKGEVGSSVMPHKVNPIDFENAEGNLGLARSLFAHFAEKLPISRLQRDLSDSTVQRNIGSACGYHLLACTSLQNGLARVAFDKKAAKAELLDHPEVIAEAIQTVLRKNGIPDAYEKLKKLTRGKKITRENLITFINDLKIPKEDKIRLLKV